MARKKKTAASDRQHKCYLTTIPPELRNRIYDMVFAIEEDAEQDLEKATPPSISLLVTCRQIHHEAGQLYNEACRRFWAETNFTINVNADDGETEMDEIVRCMKNTTVESLTKMTVVSNSFWIDDLSARMFLKNGVWTNEFGARLLFTAGKISDIRRLPLMPPPFITGTGRYRFLSVGRLDEDGFRLAKEKAQRSQLTKRELKAVARLLESHA